jgi:hypothetical protein
MLNEKLETIRVFKKKGKLDEIISSELYEPKSNR